MANVLKITSVSQAEVTGGVLVALGFAIVDGETGAVQPYLFPQTEGSGSLTANAVGMYPFGGMVFEVTSDNTSDDITIVAIPKDEYPDDTHKLTFTDDIGDFAALSVGSTVSADA